MPSIIKGDVTSPRGPLVKPSLHSLIRFSFVPYFVYHSDFVGVLGDDLIYLTSDLVEDLDEVRELAVEVTADGDLLSGERRRNTYIRKTLQHSTRLVQQLQKIPGVQNLDT